MRSSALLLLARRRLRPPAAPAPRTTRWSGPSASRARWSASAARWWKWRGFSRLRSGDAPAAVGTVAHRAGNAPTKYRLAAVDGVVALEAEGVEGGSGMTRKIRIDPHTPPGDRMALARAGARGGKPTARRDFEGEPDGTPVARLSRRRGQARLRGPRQAAHGQGADDQRPALRLAALRLDGEPAGRHRAPQPAHRPRAHDRGRERRRSAPASGSPCGATWRRISAVPSARSPATSSPSA